MNKCKLQAKESVDTWTMDDEQEAEYYGVTCSIGISLGIKCLIKQHPKHACDVFIPCFPAPRYRLQRLRVDGLYQGKSLILPFPSSRASWLMKSGREMVQGSVSKWLAILHLRASTSPFLTCRPTCNEEV
jgi:hypothetical protein